MDRLELFDRAAPIVICDQMTKFSQNISRDLDQCLVYRRCLQVLKHCPGRIRLQVFIVGH